MLCWRRDHDDNYKNLIYLDTETRRFSISTRTQQNRSGNRLSSLAKQLESSLLEALESAWIKVKCVVSKYSIDAQIIY